MKPLIIYFLIIFSLFNFDVLCYSISNKQNILDNLLIQVDDGTKHNQDSLKDTDASPITLKKISPADKKALPPVVNTTSTSSDIDTMNIGSMDLESTSSDMESTEFPINKTINGIDLKVVAEVVMGMHHPKAWHPTHCKQIPFFNTSKENLDCVRKHGWYYDMSSESCQEIDVPCGDIATLNFWKTIDGCLANCTTSGIGYSITFYLEFNFKI